MSLRGASLNGKGLWDSEAIRMLRDLESLSVDVATIQENHFTCDRDTHVLRGKSFQLMVITAPGAGGGDPS